MQNDSQAMLTANILRRLADYIEQHPELAEALSLEVADEPNQQNKQIVSPSFDVFEVYRASGENTLADKLKECSLEELLAIVKTNSLDTTGKVRKWKTPDKIKDFIVERVSAKVSKGSVFDGQSGRV